MVMKVGFLAHLNLSSSFQNFHKRKSEKEKVFQTIKSLNFEHNSNMLNLNIFLFILGDMKSTIYE